MSRTLKDIRDQVIDDLDLNEETFVSETDLNRWINDAIEDAEGEIHVLYEDYYLTEEDPVAITAGQTKVDYPADIYANKIRKIIFSDGSSNSIATHEVKQIKDITRAKELDIYYDSSTNPILRWMPSNKASEGRKIRLFPDSGRSGFLYVFYIRNATKLVADTDICDIDEFERYIVQFTKTQAYLKDGDPRADDSKILEEQLRGKMISQLTDMAPDDNTEIEMDISHYDDSVGETDGSF